MKILAIESSCDETAAAVVEDGRKILSSVVFSQIEVHKEYGGVVPEIASRYHIEKISGVVKQAIEESGGVYDAVAATAAPGLIGALLVGLNFAKGLAFAEHKPLIPVHHLRGHIAANYPAHPDLKPPFLALVVSGGHSHIVHCTDYTTFEVIGKTKDDAAGEAFDKGARVLGLPYPGGVHLDRLAQTGDPHAVRFPQVHFADSPYDFSFSGVKTALINLINQCNMKHSEIVPADIAASYIHAITEVLCDHFIQAAERLGARALVLAGGVSANSVLRRKVSKAASDKGFKLFIPPFSLCGDNAAMIGAQAFFEARAGHFAPLSQNAFPSMPIQNEFM